MSISVRFLMDLRAIQDRGLSPTFDDLLVALDKARTGMRERIDNMGRRPDKWGGEIVNEEDVIRCLEDICRRREAEHQRDLKEIAEILNGSADRMAVPAQLQNASL